MASSGSAIEQVSVCACLSMCMSVRVLFLQTKEFPPEKKQKLQTTTLTTQPKVVILIRHGDYKEWAESQFKGLTPCGKQQAAKTAKKNGGIS